MKYNLKIGSLITVATSEVLSNYLRLMATRWTAQITRHPFIAHSSVEQSRYQLNENVEGTPLYLESQYTDILRLNLSSFLVN